MTIEDTIEQGIVLGASLLTAANLFVGASTLADTTGVVDAFVAYSDAQHHVYKEGHETYPWLFWSEMPDYESEENRLARYEFGWKVQFGLAGMLLGLGVMGYMVHRREEEMSRNTTSHNSHCRCE